LFSVAVPPNFATAISGVVGDQAKLFVATKTKTRQEAKKTRRTPKVYLLFFQITKTTKSPNSYLSLRC
jgi:hypothetical protein